MIRRIALLYALAVLGFAAATSCSDEGVTPGDDIVFPESDVSYMVSVQPFFNVRCATHSCHSNETMAGNLSLTSYLNLTARPGIVIPFDSDASLLMQKIDGRLPHPPEVPIIINSNQLNGIRTWIDEGAKDN